MHAAAGSALVGVGGSVVEIVPSPAFPPVTVAGVEPLLAGGVEPVLSGGGEDGSLAAEVDAESEGFPEEVACR